MITDPENFEDMAERIAASAAGLEAIVEAEIERRILAAVEIVRRAPGKCCRPSCRVVVPPGGLYCRKHKGG